MDSYGAILRHAREEKKITVETAAKETSISQHYIEALESLILVVTLISIIVLILNRSTIVSLVVCAHV